jgi:hypothetical protein
MQLEFISVTVVYLMIFDIMDWCKKEPFWSIYI